MVKQVIVVRKDLKMPAGKLGAQVGHAVGLALMEGMHCPEKNYDFMIDYESWIATGATKIVLAVKDEKELRKIHEKTVAAGLLCSPIVVDEGRTVFSDPTSTCMAIGPAQADKIDVVTKRLRLYESKEDKKLTFKDIQKEVENLKEMVKNYNQLSKDEPYLYNIDIELLPVYNRHYGDERKCKCGHTYERHFDSWDDMVACGCKYCDCETFEEATELEEVLPTYRILCADFGQEEMKILNQLFSQKIKGKIKCVPVKYLADLLEIVKSETFDAIFIHDQLTTIGNKKGACNAFMQLLDWDKSLNQNYKLNYETPLFVFTKSKDFKVPCDIPNYKGFFNMDKKDFADLDRLAQFLKAQKRHS